MQSSKGSTPKTLKTILVPFDLGKLVLQHDASQDLELQPGDVVSIFSEADMRVPIAQQTKIVSSKANSRMPDSTRPSRERRLRQLVERAGGLTPNAYLYGSEFTRESTRAVQQARIDEYVQNLDMRIQRSNLALAASPVSSAQDLASGSAAQNSERELITRLRQIRATGRIVLEFKPDSTGPDVIARHRPGRRRSLRDPARSCKHECGRSCQRSEFVPLRAGRRVAGYLLMAGGITKDAERKRSFVIRADGEVVSYESRKGLWGNQFIDLPIYPGDTIVFPKT